MDILWVIICVVLGMIMLEKVLYWVSNKVLYRMAINYGDDYWEYIRMQVGLYFENENEYINYDGRNTILRKMTTYERNLDTSILILAESLEYWMALRRN